MNRHPSWCTPDRCTTLILDGRTVRSHRGDLFRDQWGAGVVGMQNELVVDGVVVSTCRPMVFVDVDPGTPLTPDRASALGYELWSAERALHGGALPGVLVAAGGSRS